MDEQVIKSLNSLLSQFKSKFRKQEIDRIKEEAKSTIRGLLAAMVVALCQHDEEKFFSVLGVDYPTDDERETCLLMCTKTEEIIQELKQPEGMGAGLGPHAVPQASQQS